jgi:hypothetical protein
MYPNGGHGFGMYPTGAPAHWTALAAEWLRGIHILPPPPPNVPSSGSGQTAPPCVTYEPPAPGKPGTATAPDPNCI